MTYVLTVIKRTPNPNYEEEVKKSNLFNNYQPVQYNQNPPNPYIDQNSLIVELTEAQYDEVKKAVLENW